MPRDKFSIQRVNYLNNWSTISWYYLYGVSRAVVFGTNNIGGVWFIIILKKVRKRYPYTANVTYINQHD